MLRKLGHQPGDKIKVSHGERMFTVEIPAGVYEVRLCERRDRDGRLIIRWRT